jgi:hypothetical protein
MTILFKKKVMLRGGHTKRSGVKKEVKVEMVGVLSIQE